MEKTYSKAQRERLNEIFWAYCSIIWNHTTKEGRDAREKTVFRLDVNKNENTKKQFPFLLEHWTPTSYEITVWNFERIKHEMENFIVGRTLFNPYRNWDKERTTVF